MRFIKVPLFLPQATSQDNRATSAALVKTQSRVYYYFKELKMKNLLIIIAAITILLSFSSAFAEGFLDKDFLRLLLLEKGFEPSMSDQILNDSRTGYNNSVLIQNLYQPKPLDIPKNNTDTNQSPRPQIQANSMKRLPGYVDQKYIDLGRQFIKDRRDTFMFVESKYGVPAEAITAILIIESKLGRYYEKYYAFNAYLNLASCIDPLFLEGFIQRNRERYPGIDTDQTRMTAIKKGEWALREIKDLVRLSNELDMDPLEFKGSYAGAIGPAQFIPSSIMNYFKDGNSDGIRDPFAMEDAIASIANYLNKGGWKEDETSHRQAVWSYNHNSYYVKSVMGIIAELSEPLPEDEPDGIQEIPVE
jgi:membrane-bound lytic murein transglycosylase B